MTRQCVCFIALFLLCVTVAHPQSAPALFNVRRTADLGRLLFFDPVLSENYKRSCASCHRPQKGFTDQRVTARAFAFTNNLTRNTPTLLGATRQRRFFHDGRANRLDAVIRAVLTNPTELNNDYAQVSARLFSSPDYRQWFRQLYGEAPSERTINRALVAYLRSLSPARPTSRPAPTPDSIRSGQALFARSGCLPCHPAPYYRDEQRHEISAGQWVRTPTLRNLPLTPPYLADGTAPTLEAVLTSAFHARQASLTPADARQLVRFLNTIPLDIDSLMQRIPLNLPHIPGAPPRRVGGTY